MKLAAGVAIAMTLLPGIGFAEEKPRPGTDTEKVNYSIGYQLGGDFKRQGIDLQPEFLVRGIRDAMEGGEPLMPPAEVRKTLVELKRKVEADERKRRTERAEKARAEGEAFLAENGRKEGVVTLPSGLQYQVLAEGTGRSPGAADNVTVHYRGTLIDGTEFDSSYKRSKAVTFRVDQVIAGWKEALPMMKEGARWRLFVPAKLGYGDRGAGSRIAPHSTLIFEMELISVNPLN